MQNNDGGAAEVSSSFSAADRDVTEHAGSRKLSAIDSQCEASTSQSDAACAINTEEGGSLPSSSLAPDALSAAPAEVPPITKGGKRADPEEPSTAIPYSSAASCSSNDRNSTGGGYSASCVSYFSSRSPSPIESKDESVPSKDPHRLRCSETDKSIVTPQIKPAQEKDFKPISPQSLPCAAASDAINGDGDGNATSAQESPSSTPCTSASATSSNSASATTTRDGDSVRSVVPCQGTTPPPFSSSSVFIRLKSCEKILGRPRSNSVPASPTGTLQALSGGAAIASSVSPLFPYIKKVKSNNSLATKPLSRSKNSAPLRRGKWTAEEEAYVARVIQEFNSGYLNAPAGTTLRTYLSEKLHCDPMRITKKFTGDSCIGKRVFHPAVRCATNSAEIDKAQAGLDTLERRWRKRVETQQRESAKKAAASASSNGRNSQKARGTRNTPPTSTEPRSDTLTSEDIAAEVPSEKDLTQTASWIDRAQALLARRPASESQQMQEVGSASFPCSTDDEPPLAASKRKVSNEDQQEQANILGAFSEAAYSPQHGDDQSRSERLHHQSSIVDQQPPPHPCDKRIKRSQSLNHLPFASSPEAKDAEALVGFLNTVRAAAAASSGSCQ